MGPLMMDKLVISRRVAEAVVVVTEAVLVGDESVPGEDDFVPANLEQLDFRDGYFLTCENGMMKKAASSSLRPHLQYKVEIVT